MRLDHLISFGYCSAERIAGDFSAGICQPIAPGRQFQIQTMNRDLFVGCLSICGPLEGQLAYRR
jgi:hypothetical protein